MVVRGNVGARAVEWEWRRESRQLRGQEMHATSSAIQTNGKILMQDSITVSLASAGLCKKVEGGRSVHFLGILYLCSIWWFSLCQRIIKVHIPSGTPYAFASTRIIARDYADVNTHTAFERLSVLLTLCSGQVLCARRL